MGCYITLRTESGEHHPEWFARKVDRDWPWRFVGTPHILKFVGESLHSIIKPGASNVAAWREVVDTHPDVEVRPMFHGMVDILEADPKWWVDVSW